MTMSWLRPCGPMRTTIIYKYWLRLSLTHANETQAYHRLLTNSKWDALGRLFQQTTTVAKEEVQMWSQIYVYDPHFSNVLQARLLIFLHHLGTLGTLSGEGFLCGAVPHRVPRGSMRDEIVIWEKNIKTHSILSCAWWHIPALLRLRETHLSEPILGYIERPCLKAKISLVL